MNNRQLEFPLSLFLSFCLVILFVFRASPAFSMTQPDFIQNDQNIIEYLRLNVSSAEKDAWLFAEKRSWEPWLRKQNGFISRQLLWDPKNEEATLLITWASKKDWKNIPQSEINTIQETFEQLARDKIGISSGNPFPLVFEGELLEQ